MAKVGRPRANINKTEFESLCALQCTLNEICGFFGVTDKTLNRWCKENYGKNFSEVFSLKRGKGKISLRRSQFRLAESNAAMAIFLGKQYLGQRDSFEAESSLASDNDFEQMVKALRGEANEDT